MRKRDWSKLQNDICVLIVQKLWFYPHQTKFAGCCKDWYHITKEIHGLRHKTSMYMLLPHDNKVGSRHLYFNSEASLFKLPELDDRWVHGCSKGWLATTDSNLQIILVNPISRVQIVLDSLSTIGILPVPDQLHPPARNRGLSKLVMSENPSMSSNCFIAAIMTDSSNLFVCRLRDPRWKRISLLLVFNHYRYEACGGLGDVVFFQRKIFAVGPIRFTNVIVVEYGSEGFCAQYIDKPLTQSRHCYYGETYIILQTYLVECSGKLLIVFKLGYDPQSCSTIPQKKILFKLYKFEEESYTWSKYDNLGDKSLFLGANESISVVATEVPGCRPNCIYYANYYQAGVEIYKEIAYEMDNGVFSLDDDSYNTFSIAHPMAPWAAPAMWYQSLPAKALNFYF